MLRRIIILFKYIPELVLNKYFALDSGADSNLCRIGTSLRTTISPCGGVKVHLSVACSLKDAMQFPITIIEQEQGKTYSNIFHIGYVPIGKPVKNKWEQINYTRTTVFLEAAKLFNLE